MTTRRHTVNQATDTLVGTPWILYGFVKTVQIVFRIKEPESLNILKNLYVKSGSGYSINTK